MPPTNSDLKHHAIAACYNQMSHDIKTFSVLNDIAREIYPSFKDLSTKLNVQVLSESTVAGSIRALRDLYQTNEQAYSERIRSANNAIRIRLEELHPNQQQIQAPTWVAPRVAAAAGHTVVAPAAQARVAAAAAAGTITLPDPIPSPYQRRPDDEAAIQRFANDHFRANSRNAQTPRGPGM